jgi:putative lipoprotein
VAAAADRDPWLGPDKALHFAAAGAIALGGYGVGAEITSKPEYRVALGVAAGLTAGAAKELWDLSGHGDPSWRDFTWDAIGAVTGALVGLAIDHFLFAPSESPSAAAPSGSLATPSFLPSR